MSAGAMGFLSKPFDESLLIRCLETALNRSIIPLRPVHDVCLNQRISCVGQQTHATMLWDGRFVVWTTPQWTG